MLRLITGRSGSGKSEFLIKTLGTLAESGENRLLFLVPEQYSFDSERSILQRFGNRLGQNIQVLSFSRLADYIFRQLNTALANDPGDNIRIIFMLRAMHAVQDDLEYYQNHIDSVPLAEQLLATEKEVRQAGVLMEQLEHISTETRRPSFSRKLHDLTLIFRAYEAMISQKYPNADRTSEILCRKLDETSILKGYTVAIDGFKGFTYQEMEIIRRLLRQCNDVFLALCTPDPYASDPCLVFPAVNHTAQKIIRLAKDENVRIAIPPQSELEIQQGLRFHSEDLAHLEANFFTPLEKPFFMPAKHITVCIAQDIFEECRWIAATTRKLIREEGLRCRDIAVIVRREEDYRQELLSAFHQYNIPVFDDSRQPVSYQPLMVLCRTVFDLASSFTTDQFLQYLKTGLSPLTELECAELENYILLWDIKGSGLRNDFTQSPLGYGIKKDEKTEKKIEEQLTLLNESRKKAVLPLQKFAKKAKRATFQEIGKALYTFLDDTGVRETLLTIASGYASEGKIGLAREQDEIWALLMQIIEQLSSIYGEEVSDIQTYKNLFHAVVSVSTIGTIPQSLDEITIGSADRIRLNAPKVVFVAGCEEGVFPAIAGNTGLFTTHDRQELSGNGVELSLPDELIAAEERFTAYTAVTAASERVFFSYYRIDPEGQAMYPSPIIDSVKSLFPNRNPDLDAGMLTPEYYCETERSSFQTYAGLLRPGESEEQESAYAIRSVLQEFRAERDRLNALDITVKQEPFHLNNHHVAEKLFGKNMQLSASRVDTYFRCPFRYFCQYGLNAKPRKPAELDPAQSGTVVHYVLEQILQEYPIDAFCQLTESERNASVRHWLQVYLEEYMGGSEDKSLRFQYLFSQLAVSLYDIVDRLREEFLQSKFKPADFELGIGKPDGIPAYSLALDDGGSLHITGSIDRVDTYQKDGSTYVRVVDYKTGGKDFILSDVLYGLNMQMLIYLFAIEAGGEKQYGDVKPAGILYYQAKRHTISQESHSESDTERTARGKAACGSGLFLKDPDVLTAMEKDLEGKYIPITMKTYKKKGETNLVGNLITANELGLLRKKIDRILCEMAEGLHQGRIEAVPAHNEQSYKNVCEYCDYHPVCGFEDGKQREIQKLKNEEVIEELENGEEAGTDE